MRSTGQVKPFWGKSKGVRPQLLLQHLFDAAAVAEILYDDYLAPRLRDQLDAAGSGDGRALLALVAGLHDVGKATPAFQLQVPELGARLEPAGLALPAASRVDRRYRHERASGYLLRNVADVGWPREALDWVWPLVAGHHGKVCAVVELTCPARWGGREAQGRGDWPAAQRDLIRAVVETVAPAGLTFGIVPSRATQLAIAGFVTMADWISSNERLEGVDDPAEVSFGAARVRARAVWSELGLHRGWAQETLGVANLLERRFGRRARPVQDVTVTAADALEGPGLVLVEAPTGEGKTEAALAAAEVLARRCGADGVFVGLPTQATADAMFTRVLAWSRAVDDAVPLTLLHGKRRFNPTWHALVAQNAFSGVDCFGCEDDPYGVVDAGSPPAERSSGAPAEWLLGNRRGLLTPVVVGTVDQLLLAGTRTRYVALRQAGLAGKVVILDEVHAYDVYMGQFLLEILRWLGDGRVPVVMLSATLPSTLRQQLLLAYRQGVEQTRIPTAQDALTTGYPAVTSCPATPAGQVRVWHAPSSRPSGRIRVEVLTALAAGEVAAVTARVCEELRDGGCVLVLRNTVARAQQTFQALTEQLGEDVVLLHARLTVRERARRTEELLKELGPPEGAAVRPRRRVVVATQVAEQSLDIDADLLVSDLAPVDLLVQRAGRLHRHDRPPGSRPAGLNRPRLLVTGLGQNGDGPPTLERGSKAIYGELAMLRAALAVQAAPPDGWLLPDDVPRLVADAYEPGKAWPSAWTEQAEAAEREWVEQQTVRAQNAALRLLAGEDELGTQTLAGLHTHDAGDAPDDAELAAAVRDGDISLEVLLVRRSAGGYATLAGRSLGIDGSVVVTDSDVLDEVLLDAVRLPARCTRDGLARLRPLPGWPAHPWLRRSRALVLDDAGVAEEVLGRRRLRYDDQLGLVDEGAS